MSDKTNESREALATMIGEAIGQASMCWENVSAAGVFDSTRAGEIADELTSAIAGRLVSEPTDEQVRIGRLGVLTCHSGCVTECTAAGVTPQPEEPPFPNGDNLEIINGWLVERGAYPLDYPAGAAYGAMPGSDAEPLINLNNVKGWPTPQPVYDVDKIAEFLNSPTHAPMSTHNPRNGECMNCPWPVCALPATDLARELVAYLEGDAS